MSGAEALIALGAVSSIITCINMSFRVADRLGYYLSRPKPPPIFHTLNDQLPLLIKTFDEIKTACETEKIPVEHQKCLSKTLEGCVRLINALEANLEECLPLPDDSFLMKGRKAMKGFKAEKNFAEIHRILETYKSTLLLYFSHLTVTASPGPSVPAVAAKSRFYEVPAIRVNHFVGRKYLLDRIHKFFNEGAVVVVLIGMGGKATSNESEPIQCCN